MNRSAGKRVRIVGLRRNRKLLSLPDVLKRMIANFIGLSGHACLAATSRSWNQAVGFHRHPGWQDRYKRCNIKANLLVRDGWKLTFHAAGTFAAAQSMIYYTPLMRDSWSATELALHAQKAVSRIVSKTLNLPPKTFEMYTLSDVNSCPHRNLIILTFPDCPIRSEHVRVLQAACSAVDGNVAARSPRQWKLLHTSPSQPDGGTLTSGFFEFALPYPEFRMQQSNQDRSLRPCQALENA